MITLAVGATAVALHPDLYWGDEFDWQPVQQAVEHTLSGALVVDIGTRLAGRPITLAPIGDSSAWMTRALVNQLLAWAAVPGQQMTLTLRGVEHTVMWRHQDAPAISGTPIQHASDVQDADYYVVQLRFMKV